MAANLICFTADTFPPSSLIAVAKALETMPEALLITAETVGFDIMYTVYFEDISSEEMNRRIVIAAYPLPPGLFNNA